MRTERRAGLLVLAAGVLLSCALWTRAQAADEAVAKQAPEYGADWDHWHVAANVTDLPSVQRGARNFVSYCLGCHSLKYEHWSRLGTDLGIPPALLDKDLLPPGDKSTDYILTTMPAKDAETWFGKTPPDLS